MNHAQLVKIALILNFVWSRDLMHIRWIIVNLPLEGIIISGVRDYGKESIVF